MYTFMDLAALDICKVLYTLEWGDRNDVANYRPISVLAFFAKIFDKLMYKQPSIIIEKLI